MTIDLDDLEAKAKEATPGPWKVCTEHPVAIVETEDGAEIGDVLSGFDIQYIAAANPAVILELIDRIRAAESALFRVAGYVRGASERVRRGIDGTAYPEVARPGWEPEGEASDDRP